MMLSLPSEVIIRTATRDFSLQGRCLKLLLFVLSFQFAASIFLMHLIIQTCSLSLSEAINRQDEPVTGADHAPSTSPESTLHDYPREGSDQEPCFSPVLSIHASGKTTTSIPHLYFGNVTSSLWPQGFSSFEEVLQKSRSDKKRHSFGHMYSEYLDPMRLQQKDVNLLEIGLRDGDSLLLWLSAFPSGKVYGLEYSPKALAHVKPGKVPQSRVKIFQGDQANVTLLQEMSREVRLEVGSLDFIVDDGGHTMNQQITSFTHLMHLVRPGGVYFIEDLQTSYWAKKCDRYWNYKRYCYGGGPPGTPNTTISLMKSLIDVLNADYMEDHKPPNKLGSGIYTVNPIDNLVGSIQCWRNMCALRRKFDASF